ncbi:DUF6705 family protein [Winogradskyella sp. UBA3174]|uniref:DUF6705 family protein n=1 Tax=Winogradskyella sp. UBA3174 TaxID=1947785 RepID=UPI0025D6A9B0|nr:DUF6705 family protein [Winogradskyella sp. UBA3174]
MKNSIYTLLILLLLSCKSQQIIAQNPNHTPFIGTWEYQENNQIFRITIYEDGNDLKGDYWLIDINNGVETILYESDYYEPGTDFHWRHAIFGGSNDGNLMYAQIDDNSINYENGPTERKFKKGSLGFTLLPQTCSTCPIMAEWKVEPLIGLRSDTEPDNYNIPIDIVMIKV